MNITVASATFRPKVPLLVDQIAASGEFYRVKTTHGITVIHPTASKKEVLILFRRSTRVVAILNRIDHADTKIRSFCKHAAKQLYRASGLPNLQFIDYRIQNYIVMINTTDYPETLNIRTSNGGKVYFRDGRIAMVSKCKTREALAQAWEEGKAVYRERAKNPGLCPDF